MTMLEAVRSSELQLTRQKVVTCEQLDLLIAALPEQPGVTIDPIHVEGEKFSQESFKIGHSMVEKHLFDSIVPPGHVVILIRARFTHATPLGERNLNKFNAEVRRLEKEAKQPQTPPTAA